jgi:solute carrier family 25 (mitochondrial iron transporter), member 28/37
MDATAGASQSPAGKLNGRIPPSGVVTDDRDDDDDDDDDWEEWDGKSPFWVHCVAGSLAGVVEHTAVYPLDTVRTHIQVACSACAQLHKRSGGLGGGISGGGAATTSGSGGLKALLSSVGAKPLSAGAVGPNLPMGMFQTIRHLMNEPVAVAASASASASAASVAPSTAAGWARLWRGVETMVVGCIPAHALYFSSYEVVKAAFTSRETGQVSPLGSSLAGAGAVVSHDLIMTPLDTIKQRMQLGHYSSVRSAVSRMAQSEGIGVFYRSFPVTLASNVPYGMIMVSVNEHLKQTIDLFDGNEGYPLQGPHHQHHHRHHAWKTVVFSSSVAGLVASAATAPLDRIKTALQTQHLLPTCYKLEREGRCALATHANWREAARHILETEGYQGFFRGIVPRVLSHTPAVAISWTTYETAKQFLMKNYS